jgi:hypothetical protein
MSDNNTKTFHADAGKGSRPRGTGWKNYYDNFDAIFGKKEEAKPEVLQVESLSSVGSKVGVLTVGTIGGDWSTVSIDAEGNVIRKESGCRITVEVTKADEG